MDAGSPNRYKLVERRLQYLRVLDMLCDRGPHFLQQLFQLYVPGARDQDFVERIQDLLMVGDLESRTALVGGTVSPGRSRYRRRGAVRLMAPLESRTEA